MRERFKKQLYSISGLYISLCEADLVNDRAGEIEKYWNEGDIPNTIIKVHALKSSSRIIGALNLGDMAQELENAGNADDIEKVRQGIGGLLSRYRALGKLLEPLCESRGEDNGGKPLISLDELHEAYGLIKEALDSAQLANVNEIAENLKDYSIPNEEKER